MKRSLLFLLPVVLLVGSVGCGGGGTTFFSTPTPNPTPTNETTTVNLFASLRAVSTWPSGTPQLNQQQLGTMRRAAKVAHSSIERAPITYTSPANIYVWQAQVNKKGEWSLPQNSERKITTAADLYTSVHLSHNGDMVVFSKAVNGYDQIFTATVPRPGVAESMGQPRQLTSDMENHSLPHIYFDASAQVVVFTKPDPNSEGDLLCLLDFGEGGGTENCLDFSFTTPVLKGANLWHASWGNSIVFEAWGGPLKSDEIFMVNTDGSGLTQITNNAGTNNYDECPSVNSDGTAMVFDSWNDVTGRYDVIRMDLATKQRLIYSGDEAPADGWDPLHTKYTVFWMAKPMGQVPGGLELYYMTFSPLRLTNNNVDDFFSSSSR